MATKDEHLRKAEHNERFVAQFEIGSTPFLDWVITGIFYAALHYIRALAAQSSIAISSYAEMDKLFDRHGLLKRNRDVFYDYRQLKDDSRAARYDVKQFKANEVRGLLEEEFQRIRAFVLKNL